MTEVVHFPNAEELGSVLARDIADRVEKKLGKDPNALFILGCPGGRSPVTTYTALAKEFQERNVDLSRIIIAMMDNYVLDRDGQWVDVDPDAHYSCQRFAREEIQNVLNEGREQGKRLPEENLWFPDPTNPENYDRRLADAGGIDFFILASGSGDGHVAFNPPGTSFDSQTRVTPLAERTRLDNLGTFPDFESIEDVPTHGVSIGVGTIRKLSRAAALVLAGSNKSLAYQQVTNVDSYNEDWPATVVYAVPDSLILVDDEAV